MGGQQSRHWVIFCNHLKECWLFVLIVWLRWLLSGTHDAFEHCEYCEPGSFSMRGLRDGEESCSQTRCYTPFEMYKRTTVQLTRHKACLHGGGRHKTGQVTCGRSPHLSCKRDQIKMRDLYMDRRVTPTKRVTSPSWGPLPPCKQALRY